MSTPTDVSGVMPALTPKRSKRVVDTSDYLAFVRRVLRALSRRVGHADLVALGEMVSLRDELEGNIIDAIARLRHDAYPASWSEIGRALGVTRQEAQRRYGKVGGVRRPGGQPGHLR